jgi:wobble nucleotide-excising tRNase
MSLPEIIRKHSEYLLKELTHKKHCAEEKIEALERQTAEERVYLEDVTVEIKEVEKFLEEHKDEQ